jgi:acyl-[acyl-carrier-protein]-phospholipid O-acyltransferase / long-chain-fatty-acid--[acyl-carrier-protein] ligase
MTQRSLHNLTAPRLFLRTCRRQRKTWKAADSTGMELGGGDLLTRALLVRRALRREALGRDETHVGVILPTSVWGLIVNATLALDRRVAVNLNYTLSTDLVNTCIANGGIRHVVTSRRVMERFDLKINAELIYLEDLSKRFKLTDKLIAASQARFWPVALLERHLGLTKISQDDVLTVIFTSGSTGEPAGVMLTQKNIVANVEAAFLARLHGTARDVIVGVLPFFHSFGYTTNLWAVLLTDARGVYHYSPLDAHQVGELCRKYAGTIMFSTPTFLRTYLRRCPADDFASLETLITGAEKLPTDLAQAFQQRFGILPQEGYGTTELSPVVAFNVAPGRRLPGEPLLDKLGTIGTPIPGVSVKVVDLETGADLAPDQQGMLLVSGHCVMKGYLNQPAKTANVIRDGWYSTGDLACIDKDGFIRITGRQSRFSKIGGEMVPHLRIEEILIKLLGIEADELRLAVTAVPDPRKGERIVVLHTGLDRTPQQLCREMDALQLPRIWIPSPDSFCQVEKIPVLASGKLDLRQAKRMAEERFTPQSGPVGLLQTQEDPLPLHAPGCNGAVG